MLFWTTHFSILDSTFFILDSTFWLESMLKIDPDYLSTEYGMTGAVICLLGHAILSGVCQAPLIIWDER